MRRADPDAPAVIGFSPAVVLAWLALVLFVTAFVVRWRAKNLQRRATVRIMPTK